MAIKHYYFDQNDIIELDQLESLWDIPNDTLQEFLNNKELIAYDMIDYKKPNFFKPYVKDKNYFFCYQSDSLFFVSQKYGFGMDGAMYCDIGQIRCTCTIDLEFKPFFHLNNIAELEKRMPYIRRAKLPTDKQDILEIAEKIDNIKGYSTMPVKEATEIDDEIDWLNCRLEALQAKLKSLELEADRRKSCYKIIYELAQESNSLLAKFFKGKANSKDTADSLKTGYHVSKGSLENVRADMEKALKIEIKE